MSDSESTGVDSSTAAKVLLADEKPIKELRPAWAAYSVPLLMITTVVVGGVIGMVTLSGMARRLGGVPFLFVVPVLLFGAVGFVMVYLTRMQTRYIVTNKRVLKVKGLLSKSTHTMWLRDITAIKTNESAFQRVSGYGSITVARQPISWIHRVPLLPLGNGITFGAVPEMYTVAEVIERGADSLSK